ncbi:MAG: DUF2497 domain-containing protein [Rhodovibrionaceae bacterium]
MSDSQGGSNEPSMEEILASIRRIIAEDAEQEGKGGSPAARSQGSRLQADEPHRDDPKVTDSEGWPEDREGAPRPAAPQDEDDVLELTQLVNEDGSVTDLSEGSAGPAMPFVAEEDERGEEERRQAAQERPYEETASVVQSHHEPAPEESAAVEDEIEDAVLEDETRGTPPVVQGEVDAQVRVWLDRNLPDMVERVVREEVERMLRRLKD